MTTINYAKELYYQGNRVDEVHAANHKVYPLPPAYLNPDLGVVSTPDTPDLTLLGNYRITALVRDDSIESGTSRYLVMKASSGTDYVYGLLSTYTTYIYTALGWPTGTTNPQLSWNLGANSRTLFGLTPPGTDSYIGAIVRGITPNSQAITATSGGLKSTDGTGWSPLGTVSGPQRADALSRKSAAQLRIGTIATGQPVWQGRIYWVQLEQIERAWLAFPGVLGNYVWVPDAANLQISGSIELVLRARLDWQDPVNQNTLVARFATTGTGGRSWYLYMDPGFPGRPRLTTSADGSATTTGTSTTSMPFANEMVWLKTTYDVPAGTIKFYTAPDQQHEPTVWTQLGGDRTGQPTSMFAGTARVTMGRQDVSDNGPLNGRIARFILRNGIGGPVVLDVTDNNAGVMTGNTFVTATGQTATVAQTAGNTVVQPQPDWLVWRFDASEFPAGATSFTDPRGRAWTLTAAAGIVRPASSPDVWGI